MCNARLIAVMIVLLTLVGIVLCLGLRTAIANIFSIHTLRSASLARLRWRRCIFIAIGSAS